MPDGYDLPDIGNNYPASSSGNNYPASSRAWNPLAGIQRMVDIPWTAAQAERQRQQNLQDKLMEAGITAPAGAPTGGLTRFFGGPQTQLNPIDVAGAVQQKQLADLAAKKQEQMDLFKAESEVREKAAKDARDDTMFNSLYENYISGQQLAKANGWTGTTNTDKGDPRGVAKAAVEAGNHMVKVANAAKEVEFAREQLKDASQSGHATTETIRLFQDKLQKAQDKHNGLLNPDGTKADHPFKQDNSDLLQAQPQAGFPVVKTPEESQAEDAQEAREEKKREPFISDAYLLGIPKESLKDEKGKWRSAEEIKEIVKTERAEQEKNP